MDKFTLNTLLSQADNLLQNGEYGEALASYYRVLEACEDVDVEIRARRGLARCLYQKGNYSEALKEVEEAIQHFDAQSIPAIELGKIHSLAAGIALNLGSYDVARKHCQEGFDLLKDTGENEEVGNIQRYLGRIFLDTGDFEKARTFLEDSYSTFRRIGNEIGMIWTGNALAQAYFLSRMWDQAITHLENALEYSKKVQRERDIADFSGNLGTLYFRIGDWKQAKEYLEESLRIFERIDDNLGICYATLSLGALNTLQRKWEEATSYLERARVIAEERSFARETAIAYEYLGELAFEKRNYERALEYYKKALQIAKETAPEGDIVNQTQKDLAQLYLTLGRLEEALKSCQRSLEVSKKLGDKLEEGAVYRIYGLIYEKLGDRKKALEFLSKGVEVLKEVGEKYEYAKTLREMGRFLTQNYESDEILRRAFEHLSKAKELFEELESEYWLGLTELELVRWQLKRGEVDLALESLKRAEELCNREEECLELVTSLQEELEKKLVNTSLSVTSEYGLLERLRQAPEPSSLDGLGSLLSTLVDKVLADRGFVALRDVERGFWIKGFHNLSRDVAESLLKKLEMLLSDEIRPHRPFISLKVGSDRRLRALTEYGVGSFILVPFGLNDVVEGLLYVDRSSPFGQKELNFFTLSADAVAMKVAQLREEELRRDNLLLKQQLLENSNFAGIITKNAKMWEILRIVDRIKDDSISVILEGETGTGKELIARAISLQQS